MRILDAETSGRLVGGTSNVRCTRARRADGGRRFLLSIDPVCVSPDVRLRCSVVSLRRSGNKLETRCVSDTCDPMQSKMTALPMTGDRGTRLCRSITVSRTMPRLSIGYRLTGALIGLSGAKATPARSRLPEAGRFSNHQLSLEFRSSTNIPLVAPASHTGCLWRTHRRRPPAPRAETRHVSSGASTTRRANQQLQKWVARQRGRFIQPHPGHSPMTLRRTRARTSPAPITPLLRQRLELIAALSSAVMPSACGGGGSDAVSARSMPPPSRRRRRRPAPGRAARARAT